MRYAIFLAAWALAALPQGVLAQPAPAGADGPATLAIGGDGIVSRSPDVAHVSLTIVTDDRDAARSTGKNTTILDAFGAKAAALGIAGDVIRTTYFNVNFVPYPAKDLPPLQRQAHYGFVTTRALDVTVDRIENAGKVVDLATSAGVTSVDGVSFDLKDRKGAYQQALVAALKDAQGSAEALAAGGNLRLVRIARIAVNSSEPGPIAFGQFRGYAAPMAAATPPPTSIAPNGPIDVTAHVEVTYEIR